MRCDHTLATGLLMVYTILGIRKAMVYCPNCGVDSFGSRSHDATILAHVRKQAKNCRAEAATN